MPLVGANRSLNNLKTPLTIPRGNLGATTVGDALFTLANPSAIRFPRIDAANTVTLLSDSDYRAAIGAGTSSFDGVFASLTSKPTTLAGYGITDGQTLDADLTSIAGLSIAGNGLKVLRVNAGATAYELATLAAGGDALMTNPLSQFATTTSAQLRGVLSDEINGTGGLALFGNQAVSSDSSPTFSGLTVTNDATINGVVIGSFGVANLTRVGFSSGNAGVRGTYVGAGSGFSATSGDNTLIGYNAGSSLAGAGAQNTLIGSGADAGTALDVNSVVVGYNAVGLGSNSSTIGNLSSTVFRGWGTPTFGPANSLTLAFTNSSARTWTVPNVSDTLVGLTATQTLTNKTLTSPALTTPSLGVATATTINGVSLTGSGTIATGAGFTLTVPATGTAALLGSTQTFTGVNRFNGDVGMGTDPLLGPLHIDKGASVVTYLRMGGDGTATKYAWNIAVDNTSSGELVFGEGTGGAGRLVLTQGGNIGIRTATFGTSALGVLALFNGTAPTTSPADTVQLFSVDASAGNATLGLRTEMAVVTEVVVSDRTLTAVINGVVYKILLKS